MLESQRLLGLASYYQWHIEMFADIAAPLHNLTKKDLHFSWNLVCTQAFLQLKDKLTQAPILTFPQFTADTPPFIVQPDSSAIGLGTVLEQGSCVIVYTSHTFTKSEQQYS